MTTGTQSTSERHHLTWITADSDAVIDHAVTDDALAAGMASQGVYQGLCGVLFVSAPMTAAPGNVCVGCRLFIEARASLKSMEQRMSVRRCHRRHARPGVLARMAAALKSPAVPSHIPHPRSGLTATGDDYATTDSATAGSAAVAPVSTGRHALRGTRGRGQR